MIGAIDHVAIAVNDLEKSIDFYTEKLGFSISQRSDKPVKIAFAESGQVKLELISRMKGKAASKSITSEELNSFNTTDVGLKHIAFIVQDLDKVYRDLKMKGVNFITEPEAISGGRKITFFSDPDGTVLQLVQLP